MFKKRIGKKQPHKNQSALITFGPGSKVGNAHFEGNTIHSNRPFIDNEGEITALTLKNNKQHFVTDDRPNENSQSTPGSSILNLLKTIAVGVVITVVGGLILYFVFGIGRSNETAPNIDTYTTKENTATTTSTSTISQTKNSTSSVGKDEQCDITIDNGSFINNGTAIVNEGESDLCVRNDTEFINNETAIISR
jgi:hypothetical protein